MAVSVLSPPQHPESKQIPADAAAPRPQPQPAHADFARWRPSFHIISSHGWLNDPCGPGYDPVTGRYHVGYQWNPNSAEWGDIVWGQSTSNDLVSWSINTTPTLSRDTSYDHAGVFTGCLVPTAVDGKQDGTLTYIYTAVSKLPIHYTLDYNIGSEKLAVATSKDGGNTWDKLDCNPILPGPPEGVPVTGWRDPYVARWPSMSRALGLEKETLFGIVSGGIVNETPTTFLYVVDSANLTRWRYLGPVMNVGLNLSPSQWSGDLGVNWEVTNFMTLADDHGSEQDFLIFGAEGCKSRYSQTGSPRTPRAQLWVAGNARSQDAGEKSAFLDYAYSGIFDHGLYYAANGFWDPVTQKQIVVGWITEEDLPVELQIRQNWSGCLSIPRAVSLSTIHNVVKGRTSELKSITSVQARSDANRTYTVQTMRILPDQRLQKLRSAATETKLGATALAPVDERPGQSAYVPLKTSRWESSSEFAVAGSCKRVGVVIYHSQDLTSRTVLYWSPADEEFVVERPDLVLGASTTAFQPERAPHTLFTTRDAAGGAESEEQLRIHAFYDGSVLEVFVNERTAVSTRIYTPDAGCVGLAFFAEPQDEGAAPGPAAVMNECFIWDGLASA